VDCEGEECPTRQEGYYLVAGDQTGKFKAASENTWCPVLSCHDVASCNKCSYVLPDDVQTKTCDLSQSMTFYMCGGEAPTDDYESSPIESSSVEPSSSSTKQAEYSAAKPTSTSASDEDSYTADIEVAARQAGREPLPGSHQDQGCLRYRLRVRQRKEARSRPRPPSSAIPRISIPCHLFNMASVLNGLVSSIFYEPIIQDTNFAIYPEKNRQGRLELIRLE
jgi:hypothetical protein